VDFRDPRKPQPPAVAHDSALPWRSVIVMIVLLNEALMCATASTTCFLTFFYFGTSAIICFYIKSFVGAAIGRDTLISA
jgi:hypothetical protein